MKEHAEIKLRNDLSELHRLHRTLAEFGAQHGLSETVLHDIKFALEEIVTNVISHGYDDNREHEIKVMFDKEPLAVIVRVEDDGKPFNPLTAPETDTTKSLEERTVGGLGIQLVRKLTEGLDYRRHEGKNLLIIRKTLS
jgi:anti-sigma regulatory factor (Ser/Thr protein kinase)